MPPCRLLLTALLLTVLLPSHAADPRGVEREANLLSEPLAGDREALRSDAADRDQLILTIYQQGVSLVEDRRRLPMLDGEISLMLEDISPLVLPESLRLEAGDGVRMRSQRYQSDQVTRAALLDSHIDGTIELVRDLPAGEQQRRTVRLLGRDGDSLIVREGRRVEVIPAASDWRVRLRDPEGVVARRQGLQMQLSADRAGRRDARLLYLTEGLGWQADYVLVIDAEQLSVTALASVSNDTGLTMPDARVRLIAGAPGRETGPPVQRAMAATDEGATDVAAGDFRLYDLPDRVELRGTERVQLPLFQVEGLDPEREYRLTGGAWGRDHGGPSTPPVMTHLHLSTGADGIERAMPGGRARVYQADDRHGMLFLGEDTLPAAAAGGRVELSLGAAFDLAVTRQQTRYRRLDERTEEQGWSIRVANTREHDVIVRVVEQMPGDWTLLEANLDPDVSEPGRAIWLLPVAAGDEAELRYVAEIRR